MSFRPITKEEALAIHSAVVARFGGIDGVRDEGLLESALAQPFQSFAGIELYPTDEAKACRYAYGIIKDHPFADGNKRTATALMGTYFRLSRCESSHPMPSFFKPGSELPMAPGTSNR